MKLAAKEESRFYGAHNRYSNFTDLPSFLAAPNSGPAFTTWFPTYGYSLRLVAHANDYQLTAVPHAQLSGYGCFIGCPSYRSYYIDQSGILRTDSRCKVATAQSPRVK